MATFVDRIEGGTAVLIVDGKEQKVPAAKLPKGAREGVYLTDDLAKVDEQATKDAKARIAAKKGETKSGDFDL